MAEINKVNKNQRTQQVNVKKTKKGGVGKVIFIIIMCIILSALVACFYLDVGGVRTKTAKFIAPKKSEIEQMAETEENQKLFDLQQEQIAQKKQELDDKEAELAKRDAELTQAEQDMQAKANTVEGREKQINSTEQNIKNVARIYEEMDADVAAKILMSYEDKNEVARIMKMISDQQAAEILSAMTQSMPHRYCI